MVLGPPNVHFYQQNPVAQQVVGKHIGHRSCFRFRPTCLNLRPTYLYCTYMQLNWSSVPEFWSSIHHNSFHCHEHTFMRKKNK